MFEKFEKEYLLFLSAIRKLKRCKTCLLPETFPFITFDEDGNCSYCRDYQHKDIHGMEKLKVKIEKHRKSNSKPDSIVMLSGGRDSSYGLHIVKKELGLDPIAYTYDCGMLTELAHINMRTLCQKLDVRHVIISSDISKKKKYCKKNIYAWLKNPDLGLVPLLLAGDKAYFFHANRLSKKTGIDLVFLMSHGYETTDFKLRYSGIDTRQWKSKSKFHLIFHFLKNSFKNPSYINSSVFDTAFAFYSNYLIQHNYLKLFKYIKWDEQTVNNTLITEYGWETTGDSQSTWGIDDAPCPFINYLYYVLAGFSENDTFRSHQIRKGVLSREEALKLAEEDNQPHYDSIKTFLDDIGIDFQYALQQIHTHPKLYPL